VQTPDPAAFRAFEHAGWQDAPREYDDAFGRLTRQVIGPLLDAAGAGKGALVLDVASGPGYVAAEAAARGAEVTAVDFSSEMVGLARSRNPGIAFGEGDAEALAFPEARFDAVVMNFGMLHLARPERAVAEAFRVLRPGGRYAFTVWAKPEEAVGLEIMLGAVRKHGDPDVPLPPGPPFFRFSDAAECERVLREAGFRDTSVRTHPQIWNFESPEALFEALYSGTVRTRALLRAQAPGKLAAIRAAVCEATARFARGGQVEVPMPAVLSVAAKPRG
jgi:ubiquinone/menaquinone biosynthesis C-methylase UbiE